jgi:hypothetical protein
MIDAMLHAIGICPDHLSHPDILDFVGYNWGYLMDIVKYKLR